MRTTIMALAAAAALALPGAAAAQAQDGRLTVELNKTEAGETGGCRAFFLFRNLTDATFAEFEMSLAILDSAAVIDRLLSIDAAPLPVGRTTLKLFEIPQIACTDISEILMHDIPACEAAAGGEEAALDCFALVDLVSRTSARLTR